MSSCQITSHISSYKKNKKKQKKEGSHHSAPLAYESIPSKTKCLDVLSEGSPLEYYMGRYLTRTPRSINNNLIAVIFCSNIIVKNNNLTLNTTWSTVLNITSNVKLTIILIQ